MRYFKLIMLFVFIFMFLYLDGCIAHNKDVIYYYENINDVFSDINNNCVGKQSVANKEMSHVSITSQDGVYTICLLQNTVAYGTLFTNDTNINLNGFTLESKEFSINVGGVCRIYNGFLNGFCENNKNYYGIVIGSQATCYIENVAINATSNCNTNFAINAYGTLFLYNSTVCINSVISNQDTKTIAIYGNIFSSIYIENSKIISSSDFGCVEGVRVVDNGKIANSQIIAHSNYQFDGTRFTSRSIGCSNYGNLEINNCTIYGVHSGINSSGNLSIDSGIYLGYGHGGLYCSGSKTRYKIANAIFSQAEMPDGYEDIDTGSMKSGLYIGGQKNSNNVEVFIDNCIIRGDKNAIVLRGTSGEINNSLYVSNIILDVQHIRVDNETHRIYIGTGCEFEYVSVDIPHIVVYTEDFYG